MAKPVIRVEHLGKKYRLGVAQTDTLRDRIMHAVRAPFRPRTGGGNGAASEFWALQNVSFEVNRGDVLGIVGRNGAGKSTLLKILSRITEPTTGRVSIRGRVASLLEVGTGFHPELSGRDNIFLNGAILGMSRAEIRGRFDEIVAFAEVERFLDTPVKHYSSGMYVRLAFAVAAHLEPDILIVDEVLAVGDLQFQRKCIGKMESVAQQEGRTVIFVSHSIPSIRRLCSSALLLSEGRLGGVGSATAIIDQYLQSAPTSATTVVQGDVSARVAIDSVRIENSRGQASAALAMTDPWKVKIAFQVNTTLDDLVLGIGFVAADGTPVQTAWMPPRQLTPGRYEAVFEQSHVILEAGHYRLLVGLSQHGRNIQQVSAGSFDLLPDGATGYFAVTCGVGAVLNSMRTTLRPVSATAPSDH